MLGVWLYRRSALTALGLGVLETAVTPPRPRHDLQTLASGPKLLYCLLLTGTKFALVYSCGNMEEMALELDVAETVQMG